MKRILVVDDNDQNLYMLKVLLEGNSYEPVLVRNGLEALESARADVPDLIISDILMPGMDGFALCREWMADDQLKKIPLVFYTATYTDPRDEEFSLSLGAARFLRKPMEPNEFIEMVRSILDEYQSGKFSEPVKETVDEQVFYKKYNQSLIRKLEDKLVELQQLNSHLEELVEERTHELKTAQAALIEKEKLAIIGQLAGSLGHELRNPLGVISNATFIIKNTLPPDYQKGREYVRIISEQVTRADKIITDLLIFAGESKPIMIHTDLTELIKQVIDRHAIPEDVIVKSEIDPNLPSVFVDPQHIEQILINLINNACQAMPQGGSLTISATLKEQEVLIQVTDSGVGIKPEDLEKLFTPLFTTKPTGFGLGLAISKKLAENNGGRIMVSSQLGKGSLFTLCLPCI